MASESSNEEAVVLFEYEKKQEDELNLKVGDVILNVRKEFEGWCEGLLNGTRGMFPDNFVRLQPASSGKDFTIEVPPSNPPEVVGKAQVMSVSSDVELVSDEGSWEVGELNSTPSPPPSPPSIPEEPPSNPPEVVGKAEVKFNYTAENPDELSVTVGEVLEVVSKNREEGWWELNSTPSPPPSPPSIPEEPPSNPPEVVGKAEVKFNYTAENPDELSVTVGEVLEVVSKNREEGWWEVRRGDETGLVPNNFVVLLPSQPAQHQEEEPPSNPPEVVGKAEVMFKYVAEESDELSVTVGEVLEVVSKDREEGWWEVRRGDETGLVPNNFVVLLPSQPAQHQEGKIRYSDLKFMEKVGIGGFGTVSKGRWISENKIVAIKTMVDLKEREVRILSVLDHPSIIHYYGTATQSNMQFIVTEYAENGSIHDYIFKDHKQPPLSQILLWATQVAEGMVYLHRRDIIHRDLKSSNVVLTSALNAKICDLGSARDLPHTAQQTTAVGTYAWMAPEMLQREKVSKSCDVYSYGVLLFEIATQEVPFHDVLFLLVPAKTMAGERPTIPETCDPHLADLIRWCWKQDAKARPSFKQILINLRVAK